MLARRKNLWVITSFTRGTCSVGLVGRIIYASYTDYLHSLDYICNFSDNLGLITVFVLSGVVAYHVNIRHSALLLLILRSFGEVHPNRSHL